MKIEDVGAFLRKNNLGLSITYGSGGYSVVLKGLTGEFFGCKWDVEEAFKDACRKFIKKSVREDTNPGIKK